MENIVSSQVPFVTKPEDEQDGYRITTSWFRYLQDLDTRVIALETALGTATYTTGTWTPADGSGAGLGFTGVTGTYTKVGLLVTVQATLTYPATASGANAIISGLPFTVGATSFATAKAYSTSALGVQITVAPAGVAVGLNNALGGAAITNVQMTGAVVIFTLSYEAA